MLGLTCLEKWLNVEVISAGIPAWCLNVHQSWHPTRHHPSGTTGISAGIPLDHLSRQETSLHSRYLHSRHLSTADISPQHLISTLQQKPRQGSALLPALLLSPKGEGRWGRQGCSMGSWLITHGLAQEGLKNGKNSSLREHPAIGGGKRNPESVMPAPQPSFKEVLGMFSPKNSKNLLSFH